jgi:hypothetical protein
MNEPSSLKYDSEFKSVPYALISFRKTRIVHIVINSIIIIVIMIMEEMTIHQIWASRFYYMTVVINFISARLAKIKYRFLYGRTASVLVSCNVILKDLYVWGG